MCGYLFAECDLYTQKKREDASLKVEKLVRTDIY
jgi:hypothetical protein